MRTLIENFPAQLEAAFTNAQNAPLKGSTQAFSSVVVTGLGGSGIGGKIIAQLVQDEASVPIIINNDYLLPAFASASTLVVVSSYSGNTEETLSAMHDALKRGCTVACISSGGHITDLARKNRLDVLEVPGGQPPRSQFGYSAVSLMKVLEKYGIVGSSAFATLESLPRFLKSNQVDTIARASHLANALAERTPIIYSEARNEGVAIRWRQQINENSKKLCWHHVYPEMNHNELVGWEGGNAHFTVLMLRSSDDHPRSVARMNITEPLFIQKGAAVENIIALGKNRTERVFDLIHLGDWLSLLMAENEGIDPVSIHAIDYLKNALSALK